MFIKLTAVGDPHISHLKPAPAPHPIVVNSEHIAFIKPSSTDPKIVLVQLTDVEANFFVEVDFNTLANVLMDADLTETDNSALRNEIEALRGLLAAQRAAVVAEEQRAAKITDDRAKVCRERDAALAEIARLKKEKEIVNG